MKHVFILNGMLKKHPFEKVIHEVMKDHDYQIIYTKYDDHGMEISKQFSDKDYRIYSVGGDGMLNQVIQGLVNSHNELVVIPYGTGNDFQRCLNQEKDCKKILERSLMMKSRKVDAALINDRYYINSACFGLDSIIANNVHTGVNIPFMPKYIIGILKNVLQYRSRQVKIYDQEQLLFEGPMILCTINNGQYYGGGFRIIPHASIIDGMLDVCVVDALPRWKIPYMLSLLVRNKLEHRKEVHYFSLKHVSIECSYSCNLDGDEVKYLRYDIQVIPSSINIVYSD